MFISIVGYYVFKNTREAVYDGGLWMMYESDDVEKCKADFLKIVDDLRENYIEGVKRQYKEPPSLDLDFEIDVVQELDKLPKMWKNRRVHKL